MLLSRIKITSLFLLRHYSFLFNMLILFVTCFKIKFVWKTVDKTFDSKNNQQTFRNHWIVNGCFEVKVVVHQLNRMLRNSSSYGTFNLTI